jgi:hypothetical protein
MLAEATWESRYGIIIGTLFLEGKSKAVLVKLADAQK